MNRKIDIGEDKNLVKLDPKDNNKPTTSLLLDDLPKTSEDTINEAKKATWIYWLNSDPLLMGYQDDKGKSFLFFISDQVKNKIILLNVWDYTLLPCIRSQTYLNEWHKRYSIAGLLIIGVHSPIFDFGTDKKNIIYAVRDQGIEYPVVMDNNFAIWKSLENRFWPRRILFDQDGKVTDDHTGEGLYSEMENRIQLLLRNLSPGLSCPPVMLPQRKTDDINYQIPDTTPEIFLGTKHKAILGNSPVLTEPDKEVAFQFKPEDLISSNLPYFEGRWMVSKESLYGTADKGPVKLHILFKGTDAYVVAQVRAKLATDVAQSARVTITLNDKPIPDENLGKDALINEYRRSIIFFKDPKLYHIATGLEHREYKLTIAFDEETTDTLEIFGLFFEHNA